MKNYYVGKKLFINDDLYEITAIGEKSPESNLIPMKVALVAFDDDGSRLSS